jgi:hypothetical protein
MTLHPVNAERDAHMSSKLPALAALLTLAAVTSEPALAKRHTAPHHAYLHQEYSGYGYYGSDHYRQGYGYSYQPAIRDSSRGLSPPPGRPSQTDPDPHIRFEMNRDDRDRRLGGS